MTRIVIEERELEEFIMNGGGCVAVPIEVSQTVTGEVLVTVYSRFEGASSEFLKLYGEDPFSDGAKKFLEEKFSAPMAKAGYVFEREYDQTVLSFSADGACVPPEVAGAKIKLFETNGEIGKYSSSLTQDIGLDDEDGCDVIFAAVINGNIVSAACVNDLSDDGALEINVETEPSSRGKGYGAACAASLVNYLLSRGERVSYRCRESNAASRRIAEKIGLKYTGKTYSFVCYSE